MPGTGVGAIQCYVQCHVVWMLCFSALLFSGCATSQHVQPEWEDAEREDIISCEEPGADQCVVLACDEGECGVFGCEDVDPEALEQALRGHGGVELAQFHRPPFRAPTTQRSWRRSGLRDDARPRLTFHFRYRHGYLPALPLLQGELVKHHLFPQARDDVIRKAFELTYRFDIAGPIMPYYSPVLPPGPQLRAP
jgi:uncharacterized lipoprotein (TIGR02269 family)